MDQEVRDAIPNTRGSAVDIRLEIIIQLLQRLIKILEGQ